MSTKRVCDRCGLVLEDYTGYHVRIDDESLDKHPTRDILDFCEECYLGFKKWYSPK